MKTPYLVLVTIFGLVAGCAGASTSEVQQGAAQAPSGASNNRAAKATPSKQAKSHAIAMPSAAPAANRRSAHVSRTRENASGAGALRLEQVPHSQQRAEEERLHPQPKATANKSGAIRKQEPSHPTTVSNSSAVRSPRLYPSAPSSLDTVRHRGPNPAVIGGAGSLKASNTGGIDGSRINRKP